MTTADDPPPPLPEDIAAFIQGGISITIASRDDRLVPSLAKSVGCRVDDGGRRVTILMFADAAEPVVRDVVRCGQAAVVFTQPSTNRTVQLKGRDVRTVPVQAADVALARRYLVLFADELRLLGWDERFVEAAFWHDPANLIAIRFTPDSAFQQTPGPGAGAAMDLHRGAAQ